jgi:hypothetical protein
MVEQSPRCRNQDINAVAKRVLLATITDASSDGANTIAAGAR